MLALTAYEYNQGDLYYRIIINVQCAQRCNVETAVKATLSWELRDNALHVRSMVRTTSCPGMHYDSFDPACSSSTPTDNGKGVPYCRGIDLGGEGEGSGH